MRIFVIPITRTRWALHCHVENTLPTRLTRWATVASDKWSKWSVYPPASWRGKIYAYGEALMDKIDFREYFLKSVPSKTEGALIERADIVVPKILGETEVIYELQALVARQVPYHKKWLWRSCYMLPVSSLFALVPIIPNFPLFYNLFRVYSHYKAGHGAAHLAKLLDGGEYQVVHDSELSKWYTKTNSQPSLTATPYSEQTLASEEESPLGGDSQDGGLVQDPVLISDEDVADITRLFDEPPSFGQSIRRSRHQIIREMMAKSEV